MGFKIAVHILNLNIEKTSSVTIFSFSRLDGDWAVEHAHTKMYAVGARLSPSDGNVPYFLNSPRTIFIHRFNAKLLYSDFFFNWSHCLPAAAISWHHWQTTRWKQSHTVVCFMIIQFQTLSVMMIHNSCSFCKYNILRLLRYVIQQVLYISSRMPCLNRGLKHFCSIVYFPSRTDQFRS